MPAPVQQNPFKEAIEDNKNFIFSQVAFDGGMNQQVDPTRIQSNEYPLLINGRTRYGVVEPIKLPENADPQGTLDGLNLQGVYSAGPYLIVFARGKAYYKNVTNIAAAFQLVTGGFQLNINAETVWAEQVPASSMNFKRKLNNNDDNTGGTKLFSAVGGTPQCVVCQDGSSQPWIIFEDGTSRKANDYSQWTQDNPEYVPIGSQMMYLNGILYIVGDLTVGSMTVNRRQIFRSVTGRPLDFVVNIDSNGDKGGDASTTSYAVDYDEITSITRMNSNIGAFFVSTAKNSYLVSPVLTGSLPFNEPTFTTQPLFNTGPLNNFSICDLVGDAAFIDFGGIRSFNAVLQNRNEGRNLPFSKKIALIFATLTQSITAAVTYDDYGYFAVNSIYGPSICVYDTLTNTWVGLDRYDGFENVYVVQFCEVKVGVTRKLFVRTSDNKIYELFAGTEYATLQLYLGDWCSNDPRFEQQPANLKCVFTDVEGEEMDEVVGDVTVKTYVDKKLYQTSSQPLTANTTTMAPPIVVPFGPDDSDVVRNINFNLDEVDNGWKSGFLLSWNFAAQLSHFRATCRKVETRESSDEQAASVYAGS